MLPTAPRVHGTKILAKKKKKTVQIGIWHLWEIIKAYSLLKKRKDEKLAISEECDLDGSLGDSLMCVCV